MFARNFFKGGTKVPHFKILLNVKLSKWGPEKVVIPMLQHVGAPCEPCVKKGILSGWDR